MVRQVVEDNTTKIYTGVCKTVSTSTCNLLINGKENTVKYYGGTPIVGTVYQVFIPFGNMSAAFIIVPGSGGGGVSTGVASVNGKTGNVILNANDVGALPNTTVIPTKTSELDNDSGFITNSALAPYAKTADVPTKTSQLNNDSGFVDAAGASAAAPVQSVNAKTGAVVLTQDDVGNGETYVRTHNDFTDAAKQQINTNEDNIAMLDSDMEAAQGDITTLKGNVTALTTALQSKQDKIVGGASTITDDNLTVNRALVSDGSGKVAVSNVTNTELGYLDGVTSNVQTQLNKKLESAPVISVNTKTGAVVLTASDVGALSTSDVTTTLGTSTTKVPSEKAVSDALSAAGGGDMLKATYDPTGSVAQAGGIPDYVEANGGKIDTIKVNGTVQPITNKEVDIAAVTSVNGQTGDVTVTADIPDNLVKYTAASDIQSVDGLNADTLEGHNAAYFGTATAVTKNTQDIETVNNDVIGLYSQVNDLNNQFIEMAGRIVAKSGDTMSGPLIAQNNTDYTTAQVRNVIISTADPSGGSNGTLWIKYTP